MACRGKLPQIQSAMLQESLIPSFWFSKHDSSSDHPYFDERRRANFFFFLKRTAIHVSIIPEPESCSIWALFLAVAFFGVLFSCGHQSSFSPSFPNVQVNLSILPRKSQPS